MIEDSILTTHQFSKYPIKIFLHICHYNLLTNLFLFCSSLLQVYLLLLFLLLSYFFLISLILKPKIILNISKIEKIQSVIIPNALS